MEKIKTENLVTEIKAAISDLFVAEVAENTGKILLKFVNGQQFVLSVEEN